MKNRYFGDVNDYRKYGLLRCLLEVTQLSLGVCWLLTPNDERRDGELRGYLRNSEKWSKYDPPLYNVLRRLLSPNINRDVELAKDWGILPGAVYFSELFEAELEPRKDYFKRAWSEMADQPLIFFDPDNGIEVPSVPRVRRRSAKHIYWDEIKDAYEQVHSLVIYQHFPRRKRDDFIREQSDQIAAHLKTRNVSAFLTANVVFFLVIHPEHGPRFGGIRDYVEHRWSGQITPVTRD